MKVNGEDVYYVDNRGGILVYSTVSGKLSNTGKAIQDEGFILSAGIQEANTTTISVTGLQVGTGSQPITATGPFALPQVKLDRDASNIRRTFVMTRVEATVRRPYFNITNILSGNTDANGLYFRTSATTNPTYVKENDNKTKIKFDTTDSRWNF